jgi:hypothetical protein
MTIVARALVSAESQLLNPDMNNGYRKLVDGYENIRLEFERAGVERIVYWSTRWLSVLGQTFQAGSDLSGIHVDENWHETVELPFKFQVDQKLAMDLRDAASTAGFPGQCVDYRAFPVDTPTIVADRLLNPRKVPVTMVACNVYCDGPKTRELSMQLCQVLEARKEKIAIIGISLVTTSFHTVSIDLREDCIRGERENEFVADFVRRVTSGDRAAMSALAPDMAQNSRGLRTDMGLKVLSWLEGTMPAGRFERPWRVEATGPLYGAAGIVALVN